MDQIDSALAENYVDYITVGEVADLLGISIDTVRRWEKAGKLTAERLDGKNRYFPLHEIEAFKSAQPLSTSEVAKQLGVSVSSVRRLETSGDLIPERDEKGRRQYSRAQLETYQNLSKEEPEAVLSSATTLIPMAAYEQPAKEFVEDLVPDYVSAEVVALESPMQTLEHELEQGAIVLEEKLENSVSQAEQKIERSFSSFGTHASGLLSGISFGAHGNNQSNKPEKSNRPKKLTSDSIWAKAALVFGGALLGVVAVFFALFMLFPSSMSSFIGYDDRNDNAENILQLAMRPFADTALGVVGAVDPNLANAINPKNPVPNTTVVNNRSGESVSVGGHRPGYNSGDLALLPINGSSIRAKTVTGQQLADGTIQISNLSPSVISSLKGSGGSGVSGPMGPQGPAGSTGPAGEQGPMGLQGLQGPPGDVSDVIAGLGLNGGGSNGSITLAVTTGLTTEIINDAVEVRVANNGTTSTTSSVSGIEASSQGLRLVGGCVNGQILKWNGSAWACAADNNSGGGGGSLDVQTSDGNTVVNSISTIQFGPTSNSSNEFQLTNLGGGQVRVQIGNNVLQTTNYAATLDPTYVNTSETPTSGDIAGSFTTGFNVVADAITLATDTTGSYVSTVSGSTGISVSGSGTENAAVTVSIDATTTGTTGTSSGNSGLELGPDGLRLLGGCSNNQILKWNGSAWVCSVDATGSGAMDIKENNSTIVTAATALDFLGTDFNVTNSGGEGDIAIDYVNSGITRRTSAEAITGAWSFNDASLIVQDNADASKKLVFELSGLTSGVTRTLTAPNVSGTLITSGNLNDINTVGTITAGAWQGATIAAQYGGTGVNGSAAANGQLLIGNGSGYSLGTLTQGSGITIGNAAGSITIAATLGTTIDNSEISNDAVTLGTQTTGSYISTLGSLTGLSTTGNSGEGSNPTLAVLYGSSANTAVQGNTQVAVTAGTNLSGGGTITLGSGGTVTLNSVANPSFGTSVTSPLFTNAGALTLSTTGAGNDLTLSSADQIVLSGFDCSTFNNGGVLTTDASGNLICQNDDGGAAGSITGSGTANRLTMFNGTSTITDAWLAQNTSTLELDSTRNLSLLGGNLSVAGTGLFTGLATLNGGLTIETGDTLTFNGDAFTDLTGTGLTVSSGALQATLGTSIANGEIDNDAVTLGTQTTGSYISTLGSLTGLSTTGNSGEGSNPTLAVLYGSSANTAVQGNTTFTCASGTGNLSGGGNTITVGSGGTCGAISTVSNPSFTSVNASTLQSAGVMSIETTATVGSDDIVFSTAGTESMRILEGGDLKFEKGANDATISIATPSGSPATYTFSGATGTVLTSANFTSNLDSTYVNVGESPSAGDIAGSFSGGLTINSNAITTAKITDGNVTNAKLANSSLSVSAGTGLSGGGSVSLGGSTTLNLANTAVGAGSYGSASSVSTFTVDAQGRLTAAGSTSIAINGSNIANDSVTLGTQTTGSYISTLGGLTGLSTTGNSGEGSTPTLSVLYGATANTAVQGSTTVTCASGTGNLSGGGDVLTLGSGGTCGAITTNNAVSFSTSITTPLIQNAGIITVGTTATAGSDDIILSAAGAEAIRILEGGDIKFEKGTNDVTFAVSTPSGAPATYTFSGATGTVLTSANFTSNLDSTYVNVGESPSAGDITGSFSGGLNVGADAVTLGTDTTGNFVATLTGATGLSVSGSGSENAGVSISLDATTAGTTATTSSNSGLEVGADGLRLIGGCSSNEILKWNGSAWACAADNGTGSAPTLNDVYSNDPDGSNAAINLTSNDGGIFIRDATTTIGGNLFAVQSDTGSTTYLGVTTSGISVAGTISATGTINGATISGGTISGGSLSASAVNGLSVSGGTISVGTWNGTDLTDAYVSDTLTSSIFAGSGSTTNAVDLATAEVAGTLADSNVADTLTIGASSTVADGALSANVTKLGGAIDLATSEVSGNLRALNLQSAGADLGAANVNIDFSNTNGAFVTNLTVDGTITAATFSGNLSGNATTATALAANPTDCSSNQFANAVAANGDLTCAALTDGDIPNSITIDLAATATSLAANPADCSANQFAITIAANGNLTCAAITDADVSDTLTASNFVGPGSTTSAVDLATAEVSGNLRAINLQNSAADLGAANVSIDLSNTNGSFVTNLTLDGTITAATFIGALTGNATTATALAANPGDCSVNQFATTIAANGNLTCAALTDADIPDTITINNATNAANLIGSGSTTGAVDLATAEVAGNLRATNLQSAGADLGAANVNIDFSNTNGAFVTNFMVDGTITAATFSGNLSGNATTASSLAANPNDCSSNQFATTIAANGDLTCASLTDADIPNSITIDLATAATALAANPSDCSSNQFATAIAANGNLSCAALTDADIPDTLTVGASSTVADGALSSNVTKLGSAIDLATSEVAGNLRASSLQSSGADLGAANVTVNLSNTNGSFVTNLTLDGDVTAATFIGALTGNASTASALAANPTDCSANQFATTIAANGNLSCAALTDGDIPNSITIDLAAAATALAANPTDCSVNQFANAIAASGNLACAALTDADVPDTLTIGASSTVADGALSSNVTKLGSAIDLGGSEVSGNLRASNLQSAAADLGAANVDIVLSNSNGSFVTNLTVDGTITAATFSGNLSGNATTASVLAANPTDCSANQFATTIAANGNLSCAALTDADVPDNITINTSTIITGTAGLSLNKTLTVNSGSTQNVQTITFSTPADTAGTNVSQGLSITPTIGNATAGTNTANIINVDAVTGDAQVSLNAIKIGNLTGTGAAEYAINIGGTGWDAVLRVGTNDIINGSGIVQSAAISGSYTGITGTGALDAGSITSNFGAIDVGADNITTTGTVFGNDFDRSTSGALTFGNTNATSVSICNSTNCDTISIGTNTDADTINIGDANDTATITGGSSSAFVLGGTNVSSTEFNRLDGKTAALVDQDDFISGDGAGGSSNGSGLEAGTGGIGLLQGCTDSQLLKWTEATSVWACANDAGISDIRLKKDVIAVDNPVSDRISSLRVVNFNFDCDADYFQQGFYCDTKAQTGVIAQEIEQVFPELVYTASDGYKRVRYEALNMYTLKAVQELDQKVNDVTKHGFEDLEGAGLTVKLKTDQAFAIKDIDNNIKASIDAEGNAIFDGTVAGTNITQLEQDVEDLKNRSNSQEIDLQNLSVGNLRITLDIFTDGSMTVMGDADFRGTALFEQLATFNGEVQFNGTTNVNGEARFNNNTGGYAQINPGQQAVRVNFTQSYSQVPVVSLSLGDGKFAKYSYKNLTSSGFDIVLDLPTTEQLNFSWLALNITNPTTYYQQ